MGLGAGDRCRGRRLPDGLCPQAPELSREEKLQLRKEKKQQKKKKRSEKGPAAEPPELGTPSDPGQPRGEALLPPEAAHKPGGPSSRPPQQREQGQPRFEALVLSRAGNAPQAGTALSQEHPPVRAGCSGTSGVSHLSTPESWHLAGAEI